jgi:hypothetical protein
MARATETFAAQRRQFDLEAALVHARNLTEFFWAPTNDMRPHPDGVYAIHYVAPDRWRALMKNVSGVPASITLPCALSSPTSPSSAAAVTCV